MVALEELPPRSITVLSRKAGRPDDVGEQDRGQDPVGFGHWPGTGNELEDLADECVLVTGPHQLIRPGKLHIPRALDMVRNVARCRAGTADGSARDISIVGTVIVGSTDRTSMRLIIRVIAIAVPGLAAWRSYRDSSSNRIGPAGPALVEGQRTAEPREPANECRQRRHIPLAVDVAEPLGQQHDVHRPVANQLVRDVQAVVPRVPRLRKRHRHSLAAES
jgi:hypothetical protein